MFNSGIMAMLILSPFLLVLALLSGIFVKAILKVFMFSFNLF